MNEKKGSLLTDKPSKEPHLSNPSTGKLALIVLCLVLGIFLVAFDNLLPSYPLRFLRYQRVSAPWVIGDGMARPM